MRVLVCSAARFGIANVVYNVIEKMEPLDVEITYCRNPLNPSPEWCDTVDLLNKERYERISSLLPESFLYRPVHLFYGILWYWRKAFKYIKRHGDEYDVVWLHSPHPVLFDRYSESFDPIVVTLHGKPQAPEKREGIDIYYYRYLNNVRFTVFNQPNARTITGVGPDITSALIAGGISDDKVRFVRNGVDIIKYSPGEIIVEPHSRFGIPSDHFVLLFLGRFSEAKQPVQLLKIFRRLKNHISDISLIMAGEGELFQISKEFVDKNDIVDVHFPGYVSGKDKIDLYRGSDVFILSSKYEGGYPPLVLAEAMATGTACIIGNIEAAALVKEANCGIKTNFTDVEKAAEDIKGYMGTVSTIHGINARKYAERNFSWQSVAELYYEIFSRTISRSDIK